MKNISEQDLIGYLLGALDPAEERAIEQALESSVALRDQLATLEEKLTRMPDRFVEVDPPPNLTEKTLNTISIVDASFNDASIKDVGCGEGKQQVETANASRLKLGAQTNQTSGRRTKNTLGERDQRNELRVGSGSNWSVMDFVVGAVVCFVVAVVLLPSISNSRFQASLIHCQDNLRNIGYNMASIADSYDGKFMVAQNSDQWQASQFVRMMLESELSRGTNEFICPSDPGKEKTAEICSQVWNAPAVAPDHEIINPTVPGNTDPALVNPALVNPALVNTAIGSSSIGDSSLDESSTFSCSSLRQTEAACGSYGFPAPQVSNAKIEVIRVPGSPYYVLCADAACFDNPGYLSRNHGGKGQNVLLGDLSVDFICDTACLPSGDHIYTNNQGKIQPGVFPGDNLIFRGSMTVEKTGN